MIRCGYKRAVAIARELSADAVAARSIAPNARWQTWVMPWLEMHHLNSPKTMVTERNRWEWLDAFLTERSILGPQGVTYQLGLDYMTWRMNQIKRVSKRHPSHNTALAELRLPRPRHARGHPPRIHHQQPGGADGNQEAQARGKAGDDR